MDKQQEGRDFSKISPSAKSLLLLKGLTQIPYAREAAEIMSFPEHYHPDFDNTDLAFWTRVVHFETRYWSIDQLFSDLDVHNVMELSSGFSFRGLSMVKENNIHYIDTDLGNVIEYKKQLIDKLVGRDFLTKGKLEMLPLNVLDEKEFNLIVERFQDGPLVIVNEGLLMYLNNKEKEKLCKIISGVLARKGGYWITADIYRRATLPRLKDEKDELKELTDQQRIEENMFESFEAAKEFFLKQGFIVDMESTMDFSKITSIPYLFKNATEAELNAMRAVPQVQTTWRLKLAN
jgi:O-methyltransferase involved in polyketide biosynthesis